MTGGRLRRALVRHCLRPVLRSLTALGSQHVATYCYPELGTPLYLSAEDIADLRHLYRTSRVPFQASPEG